MPIVIKSKIDGFRRGGVAHPQVPTRYPDGYFTAGQLAALRAEPNLSVVELPGECIAGVVDEAVDRPVRSPQDYVARVAEALETFPGEAMALLLAAARAGDRLAELRLGLTEAVAIESAAAEAVALVPDDVDGGAAASDNGSAPVAWSRADIRAAVALAVRDHAAAAPTDQEAPNISKPVGADAGPASASAAVQEGAPAATAAGEPPRATGTRRTREARP